MMFTVISYSNLDPTLDLFISTPPTPDVRSLRVALWSSLDFNSVLQTHMGFYVMKDY
jgi:hypothetical protein